MSCDHKGAAESMCGVNQKEMIKAKPIVLHFVGPLFGLVGSSLSAGLNGRAEPFSEAGGDMMGFGLFSLVLCGAF